MGRPPRSYVSPAIVARLHEAQQNIFLTLWDLADPQYLIILKRDGEPTTDLPVKVLLETANRIPRQNNQSLGVTGEFQVGSLRRPAPWDVKVGDQFNIGTLLHPVVGTIEEVPPPVDGLQTANYRLPVQAGGVNG